MHYGAGSTEPLAKRPHWRAQESLLAARAEWNRSFPLASKYTVSFAVAVAIAAASALPAAAQDQKPAATQAAGAAREFKAGAVTVRAPWARATPGGAKVAGVYLEIEAAAGAEDRLIGARSPVSGTVEIHDHINDGGVMRMRRIEAIPVKGATAVVLKPGGLHVMLMDLAQPLKAGETVKLTLLFEKAGAVEIEAPIMPIGARQGASGSGGGSAADPGSHSGSGHGSGSGSGSSK